MEVKQDRFGDRDEGTWQKHLENGHNQTSLTRISRVYHRSRAVGRNQQLEEHKHTHIQVASKLPPSTQNGLF